MTGYLSLILTAHVPYVRTVERQPIGEELLHETIAYSLVPLVNILHDLHELGIQPQIALAFSPILLEQLSDSIVQKHFMLWMEQWLDQLANELRRCEQKRDDHRTYLAHFYLDWGQGILHSFDQRYGRNLVTALYNLCDAGVIEPITGAATHAYLPLLSHKESIRAQLDIGKMVVSRKLGRQPRGLWLPECGYHPKLKPHIVANDTRYMVIDPQSVAHEPPITHLRPRWVVTRQLVAFIRDQMATQQLVSPELGYVGDPLYLAPQRDTHTHIAWWKNGLGSEIDAPLYDPYHAFQRAQEHASHFINYIQAQLNAFQQQHDRPGVVMLPLDLEFMGRRWFEGPAWIQSLIEGVSRNPDVQLTPPSAYLRSYRPRQKAYLRGGSWGVGGDHRTWSHGTTFRVWQPIYAAEERFTLLAQRFPHATGIRERLLNQAARELLLAQSSDWPLMMGHDELSGEALERLSQYFERFDTLCNLIDKPNLATGDLDFLDEVEELDNPFPYLNYRIFTQ